MAAPVLADSSCVTCWFADYSAVTPARPTDIARLSSKLDDVLAAELAGAQEAMGATAEEILLAALARSVARTMGNGVLTVDVDNTPDNEGFRVGLRCDSRRDLSGPELLAATRDAVDARGHVECPRADVRFSYQKSAARPAEDGAHPLSLYAYTDAGPVAGIRLDWTFDARSFDWNTVEELSEQFPLALIEVTSG
ncbi:hypothetical protein M1247_07455 [Mycobacterium sp. 21AC1]|uniref:hypothetical protein n=1 Tax=[Mycobacterium] appelbergii TaxID=2939269 RepID=UPI0029391A9A|nr:hypothetical protein [Mycobacterium sp. 21AC1]MDV3124743.1 hypothetical protein [Mycobacterium sp. 21AC1]